MGLGPNTLEGLQRGHPQAAPTDRPVRVVPQPKSSLGGAAIPATSPNGPDTARSGIRPWTPLVRNDCSRPLSHGGMAILLPWKCGSSPPARARPRLLASSPSQFAPYKTAKKLQMTEAASMRGKPSGSGSESPTDSLVAKPCLGRPWSLAAVQAPGTALKVLCP